MKDRTFQFGGLFKDVMEDMITKADVFFSVDSEAREVGSSVQAEEEYDEEEEDENEDGEKKTMRKNWKWMRRNTMRKNRKWMRRKSMKKREWMERKRKKMIMSKNKVKVSVDWHYNMYYFPLLVVDVVIVSGSESPEDLHV